MLSAMLRVWLAQPVKLTMSRAVSKQRIQQTHRYMTQALTNESNIVNRQVIKDP